MILLHFAPVQELASARQGTVKACASNSKAEQGEVGHEGVGFHKGHTKSQLSMKTVAVHAILVEQGNTTWVANLLPK